jgi:tetratricopeptide (TPR) repeat protein
MGSGNNMALDRPKSEEELAAILTTAYPHACSRKYEKAIELCDWLIQDPATEVSGFRQRAAVRTHMGDLAGAIADLKCVLKTVQLEPADYHALGMLLLQSGEAVESIDRFADAVKIGEAAKNHYYTNSSLLFGAEAKLKVCDFEGALYDVAKLPDGYKAYFSGTGMRSKEDIAGEAAAAVARKAKSKFQFKK